MADNGLQIQNTPNIIIITDSDQNSVTVTQPVTNVVTVNTLGPQGAVGPQGPSGSLALSQSGSFSITGSLTISGSSTFTNIGPAIFSGSTVFTQGGVTGSFTGSFAGDGSQLTGIVSSKWTGSSPISRDGNVEITGSLTVTNVLTASAALITGNVIVQGTASINTLVVNQTQLSTGSNQLGDAFNDFQTLYGTVTIPTGSLTVSGSVTITGSALSLQGGSFSGSGANLFNIPASGITGLNLSQIATGSVTASVSTGTGSFSIVSGSSNLLFVSSSGQVGIGTTTPAYTLDVNGTARIQGNTEISRTSADTQLTISRGSGASFTIQSKANSTSSSEGVNLYWTNNTWLKFVLGSSVVANFSNVGNLLVGTSTDAGYKLDVNGTGRFSGNLTITGSATNSLLVKGSGATQSTTALLVQNSSGTQLLKITDDGATTIGTGVQGLSSHNATFSGYLISTGTWGNVFGTYTSFTPSAMVEINTTTKGFLPPRTNLLSNISNPAQGLQTYLTGSTNEGLYYYNSGSYQGWTKVLNNSGSQNITGSLSISGIPSTSSAALLVYKSGSTVVDIQGSSGQLFSVTDSLTGSLFSVNTVAGLPVVEAFSDNTVNIGKFGVYPIKVAATGTLAVITGSFTGSFVGSISGTATSASYALTASYVNPLTQSVNISGSLSTTSDLSINGVTVGRGGSSVSGNTVVGFEAGLNNTTGNITAFGYQAGRGNTTSFDNVAIGPGSLRTNQVGSFNVAVGTFALRDSTATGNTAVGSPAMLFNTTGQYNVAVGANSSRLNLVGSNNAALGNFALYSNLSSNNVGIGYGAGYNGGDVNANTSGSNNIFIGYNSIGVSAIESNRTWIGNSSTTSTWLGGNLLLGTTTDPGAKLTIKGSGTTSATTALLVQNANASSSLVVLDNGFVGINTGSAQYNLDVNGNGRYIGSLNVWRNTTTTGFVFSGGSNDTLQWNNGTFDIQYNSPSPSTIIRLSNTVGGVSYLTTKLNVNAPNVISNLGYSLGVYGNLRVSSNITAASGLAAGVYLDNTLIASASNDTLVGLDILPVFNTGSFTNVNRLALRTTGNTLLSGSAGTSPALTVYKSGSTVVDIQGSQGQLFSITDSLSGSLFSVSNISGLPIVEVFSDDSIVMGNYATPAMVITGSVVNVTGSLVTQGQTMDPALIWFMA